MKKLWTSKSFLTGTALLGAIALSGTTVLAGDVTVPITATLQNTTTETVTTDMAWGDIDINPTGDTDCTMDASTAAASTIACDNSSSPGGTVTSGLITVESPITFTIDITYPGDTAVTLTDGISTLEVTDIIGNSTTTGVSHTGGTPSGIDVGGVLEIVEGDNMGVYNGTMVVTLDYS